MFPLSEMFILSSPLTTSSGTLPWLHCCSHWCFSLLCFPRFRDGPTASLKVRGYIWVISCMCVELFIWVEVPWANGTFAISGIPTVLALRAMGKFQNLIKLPPPFMAIWCLSPVLGAVGKRVLTGSQCLEVCGIPPSAWPVMLRKWIFPSCFNLCISKLDLALD